MENFVPFAWMGGISVVVMLTWRLYVMMDTQRQLEASITNNADLLEAERRDLDELLQSQTAAIEALTQENQILKQRTEQQSLDLKQLQSDHQALQEKYGELEQDLLARISSGKTLTEHLQAHKLEKARLHRQVESAQEQQTRQEKAQKSLLVKHQEIAEKNKLYQQAVQAAKAKIKALQQDKKQLERDLQQALYQVVALEQEQKLGAKTSQYPVFISSPEDNCPEPSLPQFSR